MPGKPRADRAAAVIETPQLRLYRLGAKDAPFILQLLNEPSWLAHIGDKQVRTLADAKRYIADGPVAMYAQHNMGLWRVDLREAGAPIGLCGLLRRPVLDAPDLGFAFLPEFTGRGYACEAAAASLRYGREHLDLTRIVAVTTPTNHRSIRLLERLGFTFEGMTQLAPDGAALRLYASG